MTQLFDLFINDGYKITFATTSSKSIYSYPLENLGIDIVSIKLNDSSFDNFIEKLNPSLVLFDRFISEEQFGWRVEKYSPNSLRILDTEDLHFVRKARQNTINRDKIFSKDFLNQYRVFVLCFLSYYSFSRFSKPFRFSQRFIYGFQGNTRNS